MATLKTENASGVNPAPVPVAQEDITVHEEKALLAGDVALNNIVQLALLPANTVPVGYILESDDLDSGSPAIILDFGILNAAGDGISVAAADGGDEWIDASTLAQAGGIALHTASKAVYDVLKNVQPVDYDRIVAVKIMVAAATPQAGNVGVELTYRSER